MKFETDHTHYEPIFSALATILDKDYEILYDSSDSALSLSATVVHKKYKSHGFHISTYLGERVDWTINSYIDLPLDIPSIKFKFQPSYKDDYPYLTNEQVNDISSKLDEMATKTLELINQELSVIDNKQMSGSDIHSYYSDGFKVLENFKNYGVKVDYEHFLISDDVNSLTTFRVIEGCFTSTIPEIHQVLPAAIEFYIHTMTISSLTGALEMANRFLSISKENICNSFSEYNMERYVNMVSAHILPLLKTEDINKIVRPIIGFRRAVDSNTELEDRINLWAFNNTSDEYFLPQTAKDIFLF